jgi:L-seryl-tRNA(Ser) seleniumtransferase
MPGERLAAGSDVVTFSGDKLVGGPQAGLVVGRSDLIARIRKDPLARAMRPDKTTLAAVAATLALYQAGRAETAIPVWRMIAASPDVLRERAERLVAELDPSAGASVVELRSTVGGGTLPGETLPSWGVALAVRSADRMIAGLRRGTPRVMARVESGRVMLDLRTVHEDSLDWLPGAIGTALEGLQRR